MVYYTYRYLYGLIYTIISKPFRFIGVYTLGLILLRLGVEGILKIMANFYISRDKFKTSNWSRLKSNATTNPDRPNSQPISHRIRS